MDKHDPGASLRFRRRLRPQHLPQHGQDSNDPLSGIEIPAPFDIEKFCRAVSNHRGRPLFVEAVEGVNGSDDELCGLWVQLEKVDCIFYEASTSHLHRNHIVLHEISHMLLGHGNGTGDAPGVPLDGLFSDIDPSTVRSVLGRASFTTPQEREAEALASRIANEALLKLPPGTRDAELDRIDNVLRGDPN
ncbi:hypothetical protein [Streptomyces sulphureus]|uniref:hypothetical protein n=1 Tax=Streptomyces sulphureus TaxID=47758 RepID=UPI000370D967|nr:hypothetical protein [Streptomyces sulphureus]